jgi:hypothetical protein
MARQATSGQPRTTTVITGEYVINEDDDYVALAPDWVSSACLLPGPGSGHPAPNNGDQYTVADPTNRLGASGGGGPGGPLTIVGGGYEFLANGTLTSQVTLNTLLASTEGATSCALKFTFCAALQVWIIES